MSERPDLALGTAEQRVFLDEVLAGGAPVAFAVPGADGYPVVGLVDATHHGDALVFAGDTLHDGDLVCCIVERGDTYDDITALIARGVVHGRSLPLSDLVTFAFAKIGRSR